MCPFNKTTHTSWLSFAFGTNNAHVKAQVDRHSPTNTCLCKGQWHIMLYRVEGSKYILVFNKQQENYKLNQYVQQNACSFATDSGYSWRLLYSSFFVHFVFRTDTWKLKDWNTQTSKLPLCVRSIFHWHQGYTLTFIIGLNNKPSSRGQLLGGSSLHPLCQTTI